MLLNRCKNEKGHTPLVWTRRKNDRSNNLQIPTTRKYVFPDKINCILSEGEVKSPYENKKVEETAVVCTARDVW